MLRTKRSLGLGDLDSPRVSGLFLPRGPKEANANGKYLHRCQLLPRTPAVAFLERPRSLMTPGKATRVYQQTRAAYLELRDHIRRRAPNPHAFM